MPVADVLSDFSEALSAQSADGAGLDARFAQAASWWRSRRPADRSRARDRLRRRIGPLVQDAGLFRAMLAGDAREHAVLKHVLENRPSGATPAALWFDRRLLATHGLAALRARRRFFHRELRLQLANAPIDRPIRIVAFGAGPCPEAVDVIDELGPAAPDADIILVGGEQPAPAVRRAEVTITVRPEDPVALVSSTAPELLAGIDFAYSPYLCDHLSDAELARAVDFLFKRLRPGGQLLLAHWDGEPTAEDRLVLEAWLEWTPKFRTRGQLAAVIDKTCAKREGSSVGLVRGPNVYVVVQKKRP